MQSIAINTRNAILELMATQKIIFNTVMLRQHRSKHGILKKILCLCHYIKVVRNESGNCSETTYHKSSNEEEFVGQYAQVRLVDKRSVNWGHNDFYDLK